MNDNRKRWEILDRLFSGGSYVTAEMIFREWKAAGITAKCFTEDFAINKQYELSLRQDIYKFKEFYTDAGLPEPLFSETIISGDNRKRAYRYAKEGFSILPIIGANFTRSDWAALDRCIKKLYEELSPTMADEVQFLVKSHMDVLRGKERKIDWSENKKLKGYSILPVLYKFISEKKPFYVEYQAFGRKSQRLLFHPHLLKHYNGRWWCLGYCDGRESLVNLSVDRILPGTISEAPVPLHKWEDAEHPASEYFDNVIGVTKEFNEYTANKFKVSDGEYTIRIGVHSRNAWNYLTTKPIHGSQTILEDFNDVKSYGQVTIRVITNIEMYHRILSLGEGYEIESPDFVRREIKDIIQKMYSRY